MKKVAFQFMLSVLMMVPLANIFGQTTPDPGLMGTHTVVKAEYNFGDLAYTPPAAADFPSNMEVIGSVHYPQDLNNGPYPVVLFLHGRHSTCYDSVTLAASSDWPCTGTEKPITSYEGYDYVATTLSSHGYIVISISANAINAIDGGLPDAGMDARGVLVQHHLDLWNTWNTTGGAPFDSLFIGKLDMQNIGTMGHSRGGEGVVYNYQYNQSLGSPYGIKAVFTLAPVDFFRHIINGVPLIDLSPYCDGDVNDNEGVHFYDDSRYNDTGDYAPKHHIQMMGANHNYFNTVWTPSTYIAGGADDWNDYGWNAEDPQCGADSVHRFDSVKQKAALNAYLPAFFRMYLGHENQFAPILEVNDIVPPASSTLSATDVFVSYFPGKADRVDVNQVDSTNRLTTNTLSGAVTDSLLIAPEICGAGYTMADCGVSSQAAQEPHKGTSSTNGAGEMEMYWSDTAAYYENAIPAAHENLSKYENLLFRATVNFHRSVADTAQDFTVQLIDSAGNKSSQTVSAHSWALYFEPGNTATDLPKTVLNTVNLPLADFTGIDLTKVRDIKFIFDKHSGGAVLISDLMFALPLCGNFSASFADTIGKRYKETFTNTSTTVVAGDSLGYYWNFGDTASHSADTSTLTDPTHTYTGKGTYTACLYVTAYRKNTMACTDTFCRTITLVTDDVLTVENARIKVYPNPAHNILNITGASPDDELKLVNIVGQIVLDRKLTTGSVSLPGNLPTGIYTAIITTDDGNVYKKVQIEH